MYYEIITKERLKTYLDKVQELNFLLQKKHKLESKHGLKGVDLSKTKVTNGSNKPFSTPEQYSIELEKINIEIKKLRAFLEPEDKELRTQIGRLRKWEWRRVIVYKYIEGWKTSEIISYFFADELDFDIEKDAKYRKRVERWLDEAIDNLQKITEKPFIKKEKQLLIEGVQND